MDDEDYMFGVLDDLQAVLQPVVNTGASRDQLADAAKKALEIVEEAYNVIDEGEDDDEEEEEEEEEEEPHHHGHEEEEDE